MTEHSRYHHRIYTVGTSMTSIPDRNLKTFMIQHIFQPNMNNMSFVDNYDFANRHEPREKMGRREKWVALDTYFDQHKSCLNPYNRLDILKIIRDLPEGNGFDDQSQPVNCNGVQKYFYHPYLILWYIGTTLGVSSYIYYVIVTYASLAYIPIATIGMIYTLGHQIHGHMIELGYLDEYRESSISWKYWLLLWISTLLGNNTPYNSRKWKYHNLDIDIVKRCH